eukprot:3258500-Rhodomonas_salina.5
MELRLQWGQICVRRLVVRSGMPLPGSATRQQWRSTADRRSLSRYPRCRYAPTRLLHDVRYRHSAWYSAILYGMSGTDRAYGGQNVEDVGSTGFKFKVGSVLCGVRPLAKTQGTVLRARCAMSGIDLGHFTTRKISSPRSYPRQTRYGVWTLVSAYARNMRFPGTDAAYGATRLRGGCI